MKKNPILYTLFIATFFTISCDSGNSTKTEAETTTVTETTTTAPTPAPKTMESFVPKGYEILASQKGQVNGDDFEDVVMILKAKNEAELSDYAGGKPSLRPLLVLVGDANGSLSQAARSDKAVFCVDCGGQMGDAFNALTIKDKNIEIAHSGGGGGNNNWSRVLTFGYNAEKAAFVLLSDGEESWKPTDKKAKSFVEAKLEEFDVYK